jgi:hypothetical protein
MLAHQKDKKKKHNLIWSKKKIQFFSKTQFNRNPKHPYF